MSYAPEDWTLADLQFAASRGDAGARAEYGRRLAFGGSRPVALCDDSYGAQLDRAFEDWDDRAALASSRPVAAL